MMTADFGRFRNHIFPVQVVPGGTVRLRHDRLNIKEV
jgi:hypothetical protein